MAPHREELRGLAVFPLAVERSTGSLGRLATAVRSSNSGRQPPVGGSRWRNRRQENG
jgi:hypothetical protein